MPITWLYPKITHVMSCHRVSDVQLSCLDLCEYTTLWMDTDSSGSLVAAMGLGAIQHKALYTMNNLLIILNQLSLKHFLEGILSIIFPHLPL